MPTYKDLQDEFRKLNKAAQRFQFQSMAVRQRLPIARRALEAFANEDATDVADCAGKALDALNAAQVEVETISLFSMPDTPTPAVELSHLKQYRGFVGSLAEYNRDIAIHGLDKVVEQVCGTKENVHALWMRDGLLQLFLREGHLKPLESNSELNDTVLQVAAEIPFKGMDLKPEAFVERLREKGIYLAQSSQVAAPTADDKANRYGKLQQQCRRMQVDAQQTEYEAGILEPKLSLARAALETVAVSEHASDAVKNKARQCMASLDTVSEWERMTTFMQNVEDGASIPSVDPTDIKHVRELYEETEARHRVAGVTGPHAIGASLIAEVLSPGANVSAVCLRSTLLSIVLQHHNLLAWRHGTEIDEVVYRVAATIPINGFQLDPNAFVERLQQENAPD